MTTNQINYQSMMEKVRTDQAIEMETNRHNKAIEAYNAGLLSNQDFANREVKRHNKVMETLQNRVNEINSWRAALEARQIELNHQVNMFRAEEEQRHNIQTELLTGTRNAQDYEIGTNKNSISLLTGSWTHQDTQRKLNIEQSNAETNRFNAETNLMAVQNRAVIDAATTAGNLVNNFFHTASGIASMLIG